MTESSPTPPIYFRQLCSGRDFATGDELARQMVNFVYLIGDPVTREAVAVDPAYAPAEIVSGLEADEMSLAGVLLTHYHADHCGGDLFGHEIRGVAELLESRSVPVHLQAAEVPWVRATTGVGDSDLVAHSSDDVVRVGSIEIRLIHTPGHTPGSQCFLVDGRLVAGDTLFLTGCGRTDLPGADPAAMYESLQNRLSRLSDDVVVYPGHRYAPVPSAPLGIVKASNPVLSPRSEEEWLALFARA